MPRWVGSFSRCAYVVGALMRLIDYGKVAATFVDVETDRAVWIWPNPQSRELAPEYT